MSIPGPVDALVRRARRRCLVALAFEHGAWGFSAALATLIALFATGTQILDWYWPLVAALAGLAVSVWRLRRRIPSAYRAAQIVDRNLDTEDAISTAYYFGTLAAPQASPELAEAQSRVACEQAREADVRRALPYHVPRAAYVTLSLAAAAAALFVWRYGVTRSLSLRPPLVNLAFDTFRLTPAEQASQRKTPAQRLIDEQLQKMGIPANEQAARTATNEETGDATHTTRAPDGDLTAPRDEAAAPPNAEDGDNAEDGGERSTGNDSREGASQDQPPSGSQSSDRKAQPEEHNPLLDKLRDAMANLLAKMKIKPPPGVPMRSGGTQTAQKGRHASRSDKGTPGAGEQSAEGAERSLAQAGQQSGSEQSAQPGQGQSQTGAPRQASAQDSKSGAGRQDGDKALRDAEQMAAMGKLSEILGRRSAEVGGEIMVEVKSGKQDLKTSYSQSSATHADTGGEIHRDEIPLLYQPYVEQYFEQVHKAPAKK